jgi:Fe-S cluster assembly protein SufD
MTMANKTGALGSIESAFKASYESLLKSERGWVAMEHGSELSWLRAWRNSAAAHWQACGLPTRESEEWRYTSLEALSGTEVAIGDLSGDAAVGEVKSAPRREDFPKLTTLPAGAIEVAFLNGVFMPEWSRLENSGLNSTGLEVSVLSKLVLQCLESGWTPERRQKIEKIKGLLSAETFRGANPFPAMNASFMHDGVFVEVAPRAEIQNPIVIWNFSDRNKMSSPRFVLHAGQESKVTVLEVFVSLGSDKHFTNSVSDFNLEEGARVSHARFAQSAKDQAQIGATRIQQKRNSFCETYALSLGGALIRNNLEVKLQGEGAEVILDGLYAAEGQEQTDNFTSVEHQVPHTTSSQLYKGLLDGKSRGVFRGRVRIFPGALKSSAAQLNKNLLLSRSAEVDTRPELEIDADDVKASHGATVGRIDPEQVFYLQARAIAKSQAERILARGFGFDIALRIRDNSLRAAAVDLLSQTPRFRLGGAEQGAADV